MAIKVSNLGSAYKIGTSISCRELNLSGTVEINQGRFVVIVGPPGEGKATLLKLISGSLLPAHTDEELTIFVPSHLRLLHVSAKPVFLEGTLLANLRFGLMSDDPDGNLERIVSICRMLGLAESVIDLIYKDEVGMNWEACLSQTQLKLLSLARAL